MQVIGALILTAVFLGPAILILVLPGVPVRRRVSWALATFLPMIAAMLAVATYAYITFGVAGIPAHGEAPGWIALAAAIGAWIVFRIYVKRTA